MDLQLAYEQYVNLLYELLLSNCPVDTGNMITHIRMNNDGVQCEIIIDTIPYTKARRIKSGVKNRREEVEYAGYTEYAKTRNEGWVREKSILEAAKALTTNVEYYL